jgi:hypothetical protein
VEIVGILAIVASLMFVGYQLKQDRDLAYVEVTTSATVSSSDLVEIISLNHDAWIRGLNGEELDATDELAFEMMARLHYRNFFTRSIREQIIVNTFTSRITNAEQYAFYLYRYPGLRRAFEEHSVQAAYRNSAFSLAPSVGFRKSVRDALSNLDDMAPPVPPRDYILF